MLLDSLNKELVKLGGEISSAFKSVGKFLEGVCNDSVEYAVCAGDGLGRTKASELELVACECERRSSVTVCGILGEVGESLNADNKFFVGVSLYHLAGLESIKYLLKLCAYENGHDSRRCLVSAKTVIIACGSNGKSQQVSVLINSLDDSCKEGKELDIVLRILAGIEKVLTLVSGDRPVIVLTGTVNASERLLVEEADKTVLESYLLHDLHGKSVLVSSNV